MFGYELYLHNLFVSRLIAKVFGIVADEVLGYRTKLLLMDDEELSFDTDSQFSRLSTCQDPM